MIHNNYFTSDHCTNGHISKHLHESCTMVSHIDSKSKIRIIHPIIEQVIALLHVHCITITLQLMHSVLNDEHILMYAGIKNNLKYWIVPIPRTQKLAFLISWVQYQFIISPVTGFSVCIIVMEKIFPTTSNKEDTWNMRHDRQQLV